jgi:MoaA/NifB/PqqE/SkfB family radical SAM enzyme
MRLRIPRRLPTRRALQKAWETWTSERDKAGGRVRLSANPLRLHLEVNDYCNLKCFHCSRESDTIPKNTGALSLESVRRLEPFLRTASYCGIAGNGEPFMHAELLDILEYICSFGVVPSTITNCTLLRQPACDRLVAMGPALLMASIDGGTKETFEAIRIGAKFETIVENLERLRDTKLRAGSPYPVLNFISVLVKENVDDLESIVRLAHHVGAAEINLQNCFPYHDGAWEHMVSDFDLIDERVAEARRLAEELGQRLNYSPMGFNIEQRLEHALAKGDATTPTAGLQLNGRAQEIKTRGKFFAGIAAEKGGRGGVALLEAPPEAPPEAPQPPAPDTVDNSNGRAGADDGGGAGGSDGCSGNVCSNTPRLPDGRQPGDGVAAEFSAETHRIRFEAPPAPNENAGEPKYYCQNVFQQFHVNVQGVARVCCFWTQGSLGNINETSPAEMWNSEQFQGVRRDILNGRVPLDCQTCHHLVPFDRDAIRADTWREVKEALKRP